MLAVRVWSTYQKDNIKLQEWCDGVRIADLKFSEQIHGLTLDQCVQTFFFNAETPKNNFPCRDNSLPMKNKTKLKGGW